MNLFSVNPINEHIPFRNPLFKLDSRHTTINSRAWPSRCAKLIYGLSK
jgi:hypothetical protein